MRNPKIAAALYDTRLAETKGSGIRVMRESMEQAGLVRSHDDDNTSQPGGEI